MHDIDFLPPQYHDQHVERRAKSWRVVVVSGFLALLAAAAAAQYSRQRRVEAELADLQSSCEQAAEQQARLSKLQRQLAAQQAAAELYTYLRHPWPRTQILAALVDTVPTEVTFQRIQISVESRRELSATPQQSRAQRRASDEEMARLPPAARDLRRLREEFDATQTTIQVVGTTTQAAALHGYLGRLARNPLFAKAELDSIESVGEGQASEMRFEATLTVIPGYGQPAGPTSAPPTGPLASPAPRIPQAWAAGQAALKNNAESPES